MKENNTKNTNSGNLSQNQTQIDSLSTYCWYRDRDIWNIRNTASHQIAVEQWKRKVNKTKESRKKNKSNQIKTKSSYQIPRAKILCVCRRCEVECTTWTEEWIQIIILTIGNRCGYGQFHFLFKFRVAARWKASTWRCLDDTQMRYIIRRDWLCAKVWECVCPINNTRVFIIFCCCSFVVLFIWFDRASISHRFVHICVFVCVFLFNFFFCLKQTHSLVST